MAVSTPITIHVTSDDGYEFAYDVEGIVYSGERNSRPAEVYVYGSKRDAIGGYHKRKIELIEGFPYTDPVLAMLSARAWMIARSDEIANDLAEAWAEDYGSARRVA